MNNKELEKCCVPEERDAVMHGEREGAESVPSLGGEKNRSHLFQPGQVANPKGRPKGVPNKVTKSIREAVIAATQAGACHEHGLTGWLIERAHGGIEDKKIFGAMVSRVIPVEITGTDGGPIKIDLGWLSGRNVSANVIDADDVTPTAQDAGNALPSPVPTDYQSVEGSES